MANTPPNPFDQQAVDKYLADKEVAQAAKTKAVEDQAAEAVDTAAELDEPPKTPAHEALLMLNYWAEQGPEAYAEAVTTIAGAIMSTAEELAAVDDMTALGTDAVLVSARLGKSIEAAGKKLYYAGRTALWALVHGAVGKHTTAKGETFTFKSGAKSTTRVDSKLLKADFPDVYEKVATTTTKSADTPGTLYL